MPNDTASFSIKVTGDVTGETWHGSFKTRLRLSHRDQFRQDQIRRELLGGVNPESASKRALNAAEVFSVIAIHIFDAPKWWLQADNGLLLEDDNVIAAVYEEILKAKAEAMSALVKKGEEAKADLKNLEAK